MAEDLLDRAADLQGRGRAFALATVVRGEAPTSAKPGAKALILDDGTVSGWVGGAWRSRSSCARRWPRFAMAGHD